jgi:hypothetical protein
MAKLSEIIKYQRSQGKGVSSSLAVGIKERLKEKFDPRKMFNQKGLMVSLFPGLKAYKAKTTKEKPISKNVTGDFLTVKPLFESIDAGSTLSAKNSMVLPSMHRDFNIMRQNVIKLVKLESVKPATKADMYFVKASEREKLYESEMQTKKGVKSSSPVKIQSPKDSKSGSGFSVGFKFVAILAAGALIVKAIEKIEKEDIAKALTDFIAALTGSSLAEAAINRDPYSRDTTITTEIRISDAERTLNTFKFKDLTESQKQAFLDAQFKSEGNKPGTIAYDQNNPGAMVFREEMKQFGGEPGKTVVGSDGITRTFAKFPTMEKGREAQKYHWDKYYGEKPLGQSLRSWVTPDKTPESEQAFSGYADRTLKAIEKAGSLPAATVASPPPAPVVTKKKSTFNPPPPIQPFPSQEVRPPAQTGGDPKVKVDATRLDTKVVSYGTMNSIDNLVLHHTGGHGLQSTIKTLEASRDSEGTQYATHYVVDRDGKVYQIRPDSDILYHIGKSKRSDVVNANSLGVEIIGKDSFDFTPEQVVAVKGLASQLRQKYGISSDRIFGHGEIAAKQPTEGTDLAKTLRKEFSGAEAENKTGKKVSLIRGSENIGESISLASAKLMLEEELGLNNSVFILSQNNTHTNTVYLPRAGGNINPVKQLLTSSLG